MERFKIKFEIVRSGFKEGWIMFGIKDIFGNKDLVIISGTDVYNEILEEFLSLMEDIAKGLIGSQGDKKIINNIDDIMTEIIDLGTFPFENWKEYQVINSPIVKRIYYCLVDDYKRYQGLLKKYFKCTLLCTIENIIKRTWEKEIKREIKKEKKIYYCRVCKEFNEYMDSDDIEDDNCFTCWNCANDYRRILIGLTGDVKNKIMMIRKYNNIRRSS